MMKGLVQINLFILMLLMVTAVHGNTAEITDYRQKIAVVRLIIASEIEDPDLALTEDAISEMRKMLPEKMEINIQNGETEVSNLWLHERLTRLETEEDRITRNSILLDIDERLSSIDFKATELEIAEIDEELAAKDENKQKIAGILEREEYKTPGAAEDSFFTKLWNSFFEWLGGLLSVKRPTGNIGGASWITSVLQIVLIGLIVLIAGFVIYKFAPLFKGLIKRRERPEAKDRVILGETIGSDESAEDIFAEAEALARSGEIRPAIRKAYIALLCELNDRKLIRLAGHKTNRDYLADVKNNRGLFETVRVTTGLYEINWYGYRKSDQEDWERFRSAYKEVLTHRTVN